MPTQRPVIQWLVRIAVGVVLALAVTVGRAPPQASAQDGDGDGVPDAIDNCVAVWNPGQENFDGDGPPFGDGVGIGNGKGIAGDDATVPSADTLGDACDLDDDNDGIADDADPDPRGDNTYDDNNDGTWKGAGDDGPSWDSNMNAELDGREADCPLAVNPNGDDDGDFLLNTWEVCKWGTDPTVQDSDADGIEDALEAADVNGDGLADCADTWLTSQAILLADAAFGKDGDFDIDGNDSLTQAGDVIQVAKMAGTCSVTLSPSTATNLLGSPHSVTATVIRSSIYFGDFPIPGVAVTFQVSGVNAGATGVCAPNPDCTTNASGQVTFTYTGSNPGDDTISASATAQLTPVNDDAAKTWQENFDGDGPPLGIGAGIGNGKGIPGDDATVPNADTLGDPDDPDDDNDGVLDGVDPDPRGDNTYDDNNDGTWQGLGDDGPSWDSDSNGIRDGWVGPCGAAVDTDTDSLLDSWENCKWGTNPAVIDSDGDGIGDGVEAADVNGDGLADCADTWLTAQAVLVSGFGQDGDFDINGDDLLNTADMIEVARRAGTCSVTLSPSTATNLLGSPHSVTATVIRSSVYFGDSPISGVAVTFQVSGVNAGATGVCAPNPDCTTSASGQVTFTYSGSNPGDDTISASATVQLTPVNDDAAKSWQENFDGDGPLFGIANGKGIAGDDATVPNADTLGDPDDPDDDNDGILDGLDPDPRGDNTYDDNGDGTWQGAGDDGPSWDSDSNGIRDGWVGPCGAAVDTDTDGLLNSWENCKWGTNPAVIDSDGDGRGDCREAADVDGNGVVNFTGDVILYARAVMLADAAFGKDGDFDIDGNDALNFTGDVIQEAKFAQIAGLCQ